MTTSNPAPSTIKLPVDLSPAERAALKLYWHIAIIAIFNGALAALALISQQKIINWQIVLTAFVSQAVIAALATMQKYTSASNQPALSTFFDLARQEAVAKSAPVPFSANEQAIQQAIMQVFFPGQNNAGPANAALPAVASALTTEPAAQGPTPIPHPAGPAPSTQETINTLPNISAIGKAQG
jgi:hypothetical protein